VKILVIKPSSLGDVIHGLRVMKQVHSFFPDAKIDWVIKEELTEILLACGFVHDVFHYKRGGGLKLYLKLIQEIRRERYDYILDLQGLLRSGIITFLAKGGSKLGVADGREFSTVFYSSIGEKSRKKEIHAIDKLTPFLKTLGINDFDPSLPLKFDNSYLSEETQKLLGTKPFIMLFPESRRSEKMWPYFEELFGELKKESAYEIVIAGNNEDGNFKGSIDLRGKLSLTELPFVISKSKAVITNDSAPLHIASAMSVPTVALFGPTSKDKYGPYPKSQINFKVIEGDNNQITTISRECVLEALKELLYGSYFIG
jgi:heptosyltransferase-1